MQLARTLHVVPLTAQDSDCLDSLLSFWRMEVCAQQLVHIQSCSALLNKRLATPLRSKQKLGAWPTRFAISQRRNDKLTSHIENHALGMLIKYGLIVATAETKALQLLPAQECLCWNSAYETTVLKAKLYTVPSVSAITLRLKLGYENRSRNLATALVEELGSWFFSQW